MDLCCYWWWSDGKKYISTNFSGLAISCLLLIPVVLSIQIEETIRNPRVIVQEVPSANPFWKFHFFKNANFRKSKFPGRFPFSLVCTWIAGKNVPGQWVGLGLEISIEPLWQPWLLPLQLGWAVLERESREGEERCRQRLWLRPQVPPVQRSGMSHSTSYHLSKWLIKSQSTYLITKQGIPHWLSSDGERFMSTLIRYFSVSHSIMHWQDVFKWSLTYS